MERVSAAADRGAGNAEAVVDDDREPGLAGLLQRDREAREEPGRDQAAGLRVCDRLDRAVPGERLELVDRRPCGEVRVHLRAEMLAVAARAGGAGRAVGGPDRPEIAVGLDRERGVR